MRKRIVLGIDLGTSSCKACAVDAGGRLLGVESAPYPILSPHPGWSEQDARAWLPATETAVARLAGTLPDLRTEVGAVSVSSAAHIPVLLDETGEPIRNAILWNDQRAGAESARLVEELGEHIFAQTCNQASPTWTLPQLVWVREHEPDAWRRTRRICLSKDYGILQLTGRLCTDPATAVSALLYDVRAGRWSPRLLERLGIGPEMLPRVLPVTEVVGPLLPAMADRLGLSRAIPVVAGTLDSVAETYCTGAAKPGDCVIRLGTGGGVQLLRPGPVGHPKLISYPYPLEPLWLSQAGTNACGASIDWAGRLIGEAGGSPEVVSRLAAAAPPGAGGVIYHPYLLGERCPHWDGALRGSFVGLGLGHGPEHLARAVLEGIAYSLRDAFGVFQEGEDRCEAGTMTMVGGGTQSAILSRVICDVFGREIRVNPVADSAYGAALLALPALGASLSAPPEAPEAFLLVPDREASDRYAEGFAAYRAVTDRLREYYHRIPSIPDRPVDPSTG